MGIGALYCGTTVVRLQYLNSGGSRGNARRDLQPIHRARCHRVHGPVGSDLMTRCAVTSGGIPECRRLLLNWGCTKHATTSRGWWGRATSSGRMGAYNGAAFPNAPEGTRDLFILVLSSALYAITPF
jgi:hypothetical protein